MIEQPLSNLSWQIYINRSEYPFYHLLKMSNPHLCYATKTKKLHIILLRLLRKIKQSRRLSNHLSFYRLWICMCWCKSDFSWTSEIFSGVFCCGSRFRKSCFQCGKIYDIERYPNILFTFIKFCLYCCVWCWNSRETAKFTTWKFSGILQKLHLWIFSPDLLLIL